MESWKEEPTSTSGGLQHAGSSASAVIDLPVFVDPHKLPSSQYKGVWLGTFNNEPEVARAYDVAVQSFRGGEAITNFTHLTKSNAAESTFIQSHTKDEIVEMLRKHNYQDDLESSQSYYNPSQNRLPSLTLKMVLEPLFEKTVTPSDVGKLNRLVIPKLQAEKHLPLPGCGKGLLLNLVDGCSGAVWSIRYSYWSSSQSYVLTKGWSRFVREKGLKAGDVVTFMRSTGPEKQLYIDRWVGRNKVEMTTPVVGPVTSRVVKLFGVNICGLPGKRAREVEELTSLNLFRRQRIESLNC